MSRRNLEMPERIKPRRRWGCWFAVLLFGLLLCASGGILWWQFSRPTRARGPEVILRRPDPGTLRGPNQPNTIFVVARDPQRVARVELWADGKFVEGRASSVPNGTNPFPVAFEWRPTTAGAHQLSVLVYSTDNRVEESNVLTVNVPSSSEQAAPAPTGQANPPGQTNPPGQANLPGQAVVWGPPLLFREQLGGPGNHPSNLTAEIMGCEVRLRWIDEDTDEVGYHIYRFAPGMVNRELVGIVDANVTEFTVPMLQAPRADSYQFYVARLLSNRGEWGRSNTVTVGAPMCLAAGHEAEELIVGADALRTIGPYDDVYCYLQLGFGIYSRVPHGVEFIQPVGGKYNIQEHLAGQNVRTVFWPGDTPLPVNIECWGWRGGALDYLGRVGGVSIPLSYWDGQVLTATSGTMPGFTIEYRIYRRRLLPEGEQWIFTDPNIPPPINLSGTANNSPEEIAKCLSHVFSANSDITALDEELCTKNWAVMWDWFGNDYVADSPIGAPGWNLPGRIYLDGFRIYVQRWIPGQPGSQADWVAAEVHSGRARGALTQFRVCGQTSEYRVTAFSGDHESPKSSESLITTGPPCKAWVRVRFETLTNNMNTIEAFGTVYVNDQMRSWGCPSPGVGEGSVCGPVELRGGRTMSWADVVDAPHEREFLIPLDEGETLTIGYGIEDDDPFGIIFVDSRTIELANFEDWATFRSGLIPIGEGTQFTTYVEVTGLGSPEPGAGAGGGGVKTDLVIEGVGRTADGAVSVHLRNQGYQFLLSETVRLDYADQHNQETLSQVLTIPVGGQATITLPYHPPTGARARVTLTPLSFIDPDSGNNVTEHQF